ncbi:MAG: glucosamine-6-phosphate deaminase [Cyclobacteriaceae bacterium]|jgi:glucosamine-6-phosphate isomerase|nr:glucosamine-6-phosphate deaminase [Cyclobacteriaceae bacterium]
MTIQIHPNHEQLSHAAAEAFVETVRNNPHAVICVSTGDTPTRTYQVVVEMAKSSAIDFSHITLIALDEWVGIPPSNPGSCYAYLHQHLIDPLNLRPEQFRLFDAQATDLDAECQKTSELILKIGGLDLVVAGVGMNGHIGFNEPGTPLDKTCHVVELEPITREVGQKYFTGTMSLQYGITVGLKPILQSKTLMLLASGEKKAPVMQQVLEGKPSIHCPASLVQQHPNSIVLLDEASAALIKKG